MLAESFDDPPVVVVVRARDVEHVLSLLAHTEVTLGRDQECDVVLSSSSVSRRHLSIFARDGQLFARDHSSNGTHVDGSLLHGQTAQLASPCQLQVGPYCIELSRAERSELPPESGVSKLADANTAADVDAQAALRRRARQQLFESLDLSRIDASDMDARVLRPRVLAALQRILTSMQHELPAGADLEQLRSELCDEVLGLGPLEPLLRDEEVSEIMLVDARTIYVERRGRLSLSGATFTDDTAVRAAIERIVTPLGRRIDEAAPLVDARLLDGSRVNAVIPPLALKGPCLTIRKFARQRLTLDDLVRDQTLSCEMASFLSRAVRARANLLIAGGTGSGKTTLLKVLSGHIAHDERVITIEDAAELKLEQRHVVELEARPANMEGKGAVTIRELVRNALRMRPDRILVGECRGGEALDMLQAMNTGHDGSMTTTHANTPHDALLRIETLCLMSGLDLPLSAIRRQVASSLQLVVQLARLSDGARRITHVSEVVGVAEQGHVETRDIFRFVQTGIDREGEVLGHFAATGFIPALVERFLARGFGGISQCW